MWNRKSILSHYHIHHDGRPMITHKWTSLQTLCSSLQLYHAGRMTEKQKPLRQNKDPLTPCIYNAPEERRILIYDSNIKWGDFRYVVTFYLRQKLGITTL